MPQGQIVLCPLLDALRMWAESTRVPAPCDNLSANKKFTCYAVPCCAVLCCQVWADVYTMPVPGCDGKTAAEIFEEAGCTTPAAPSCAACLGGPRDTFARMNEPEVCVSTTNRNFPGRMGHKEGQIYLASPYTAAASALKGFVCDPRDYM